MLFDMEIVIDDGVNQRREERKGVTLANVLREILDTALLNADAIPVFFTPASVLGDNYDDEKIRKGLSIQVERYDDVVTVSIYDMIRVDTDEFEQHERVCFIIMPH